MAVLSAFLYGNVVQSVDPISADTAKFKAQIGQQFSKAKALIAIGELI